MKKLLLITIILLLQSFPSFGEWKEIYSYDDSVVFIEVDTIKKKGNLRYYNLLYDFFEPTSNQLSLSLINREKMNCETTVYEILREVYYLNSMGKGKIVSVEEGPSKSDIVWGERRIVFNNICK